MLARSALRKRALVWHYKYCRTNDKGGHAAVIVQISYSCHVDRSSPCDPEKGYLFQTVALGWEGMYEFGWQNPA